METPSLYLPFVRGFHRSPVDTSHSRLVLRAFVYSLFLAWTSCLTNSRVASDLRRYEAAIIWFHDNDVTSFRVYNLHDFCVVVHFDNAF